MKFNDLLLEEKESNIEEDFKSFSSVFNDLFSEHKIKIQKLGKRDLRMIATSPKKSFKVQVDMSNIGEQYLMEVFFDIKTIDNLPSVNKVFLEDGFSLSIYNPKEEKISSNDFEKSIKKHIPIIKKRHKNYIKFIKDYLKDLS